MDDSYYLGDDVEADADEQSLFAGDDEDFEAALEEFTFPDEDGDTTADF